MHVANCRGPFQTRQLFVAELVTGRQNLAITCLGAGQYGEHCIRLSPPVEAAN
jgi:hypothetical protein